MLWNFVFRLHCTICIIFEEIITADFDENEFMFDRCMMKATVIKIECSD